MKHTSGNQVNIQIKLCVHPNIISKGTKAWIKRSLRVVTWLGYKRKDISGTIEFKWPSIREHSFYSHSTNKFTIIPLLLNTHFGVKTWYTVILTTYFSFFFFSFVFHVHILFFFLFLCTIQCCFDHTNKNFTNLLDKWFTSTFSPQLEQKHTLFECSLTLWQRDKLSMKV